MIEKQKLDELWKEFLSPVKEKLLYGNYRKPQTLISLENLLENNSIDLEWLGFYLDIYAPIPPQPIDLIPFASTGVDGTFFAFLTDFGRIKNLEEAPIVMFCAADFNYEKHSHGFLLVAKNLLEFLAIIIKVYNPYLLYEEDPRTTNFELRIEEHLEDDSIEDHQARRKTIAKIKKTLKLPEIENLNKYYKTLFNDRLLKTNIKTKDGLGIQFKDILDLNIQTILPIINKDNLILVLEKSNLSSRLKFYRDFDFIYQNTHKQELLYVWDTVYDYLKKDSFFREAEVLKYNLQKQKTYYRYHKLKESI